MSPRLSRWSAYGLAAALSAAVLLLRHAIVAPQRPVLVLLLVAPLVSGFAGGRGPAVLALALTATGSASGLVRGSGGVPALGDVLHWLVFCAVGVATVVMIERLRRSTVRGAETRARAERERTEHDRLREFARAAPIGVALGSTDGTLEWVNEEYLRIVGYTRREFETGAIRWDGITPPEGLDQDRRALDALPRAGAVRYTKEYVHRDGHRVPVLIGLVAQERGLAAFVLDQSEQRAAELALREAHAQAEGAARQLRLALDAAQMGAFDCRTSTGEVSWDEQAQRTFGLVGVDRITFQRGLALVHPGDQDAVRAAAGAALSRRGPGVLDVQYRCIWPDRSVHWVVTRGRVLFDGEGEQRRAVRVIGIHRDITAQKEAEKALRLANQRLAEADRRKDEFLGVLSHELRNPLAPIRNSLRLLRQAEAGSAAAGRAREIIERQVGQMTRLVDDLLDVTRITRGKVRLQSERVELEALVRATVEDYRPLFAERGVGLEFRAAGPPPIVNGDPTRLAQIVGNLLHNAAKFTPAGGRAEVGLAAESGDAVVRVRDTGSGIDPAVLPRIFEPFQQAGGERGRAPSGLGLGLALIEGLVDLHGGTVTGHSAGAGQGAEFVVRLPLARAIPATPDPVRAGAAPAARPVRVLVVDDNEDAAVSLRDVLLLDGHEVELAFTGADALAKARERRFDALLCDIGLPDMEGYEVAAALRRDAAGAGLMLIAVTGYGTAADQERAALAGFDAHVTKPADLDRLRALLGRADGRRSRAAS